MRNAGDARIRGFEADLFLRPAQGLTWSTGVSFNDAKMRHGLLFTPRTPVDPASIVFGTDIGRGEGHALAAHRQVEGQQPRPLRMERVERRPCQRSGQCDTRATARETFAEAIQDIYGKLDAYALVDCRRRPRQGPWTVDLFVKNLFDARGQSRRASSAARPVCGDPGGVTAIGGKIYTTVTRPRTVGLRVGRKF